MANLLSAALVSTSRVLLCGNHGTDGHVRRLAAEFVSRFGVDGQPVPAIALTNDQSVLSGLSHGWQETEVLARQVQDLAHSGDVVIGVSSGTPAPALLRALQAARRRGATRVGFTGLPGGELIAHVDVCFVAPAASKPQVRQLQALAWRTVCAVVESALLENRYA